MIPFTCPCCEVSAPPHSDGCTFHADCPADAETFDEVSALRSEIARLRLQAAHRELDQARMTQVTWFPCAKHPPGIDGRLLIAVHGSVREAMYNDGQYVDKYGPQKPQFWASLPMAPQPTAPQFNTNKE